MRRFEFRLESVLGWRGLELGVEKSRIEKLFAERRGLDEQLRAVEDSGREAARLFQAKTLGGPDLAAFGRYRHHLERETQTIGARRADCEKRIAAQQRRILEAERKVRLLERLRERRLAEWTHEFNLELDALASETFLAKWARERGS
jgi:flagellar export protein FliJ